MAKPRLTLLAVLCGTRASTCNAQYVPLTAVHLPDCAHAYLRQGADKMEQLPPNGSSLYPPINVGRAYLIHYTKNRGRLEFQRMQLPQLGVPVSIVGSFDAEKIDAGVMRCVVPATPSAIPRHPWKLTQYFYEAHGDEIVAIGVVPVRKEFTKMSKTPETERPHSPLGKGHFKGILQYCSM